MASVLLNCALVACKESLKSFDMWPEKIAHVALIRARLEELAVLGKPACNDVNECIQKLEAIGIAVAVADAQATPVEQDLDFEFMRQREVRQQMRLSFSKPVLRLRRLNA